jgi:serine phosphatase RsbU (regulator of sigma subunit)
MYNKLLERQIKRNLKGMTEIPEELKAVFQAVSDSYNHYESDRSLLERSLEVSSTELNQANSRIREQLSIIEEKNKNITDSINYAKRIQQAILPGEEEIKKSFPDSFILYRPKDVVSGDFYWFAEREGKRLIAAADCTGHGVPGAFMSMIGTAFLNEIVNERGITRPAMILSELRHRVIAALKQHGTEGEQKDGMDISLLAFDEKGKAEWAGANNPLWLMRSNECLEYKPDKRPIGFYRGQGLPFTHHEVELKKGDSLYLFTDGYADQFGGSMGKKFKYRQMQDVMLSVCGRPMSEQHRVLHTVIEEWKGTLEQVDDILVLGIRI